MRWLMILKILLLCVILMLVLFGDVINAQGISRIFLKGVDDSTVISRFSKYRILLTDGTDTSYFTQFGSSNSDSLGHQPPSYYQSRSFFNVKDFGVVGDSTTDDTDSLQAVLDSLDALGGGICFIPKGTYRTSYSLMFGSNTHILGEIGAKLYYGGDSEHTTILVAKSWDTTVTTENVIIEHLILEATVGKGNGIGLPRAKNIIVRNCRTAQLEKHLVDLCGSQYAFLERNYARATGGAAYQIDNLTDGSALYRQLSDSSMEAVPIRVDSDFVSYATVTNNIADSCYVGVQLHRTGGSDILIKGNILKNCSYGIGCGTGSSWQNISIQDNIIHTLTDERYSNFVRGIQFTDVSVNNLKIENNLVANCNIGIFAGGAITDLSICNNTIDSIWNYLSAGKGLLLNKSASGIITGNRFSEIGIWKDTSGWDMAQSWSANDTVAAIFINNCTSLMITDNYFQNIFGTGMAVDSTSDDIEINDNKFDNFGAGIQIRGASDNVRIYDNTFTAGAWTWYGVYDSTSGTDVTLIGNTFNGTFGTESSWNDRIDSIYETIVNVAKIGDDTTNFKTAYGWGDHSAEGYLNTLVGVFAYFDQTYFDTLIDASGDSIIVIYADDASTAHKDKDGDSIDVSSYLISETGDIEGVTAGNGLEGGGTSGTVVLGVRPGSGIDTTGDLVKVKPGTGIDTTGGTINHTVHTGDVTGATELTIAANAVESTMIGADQVNDLDVNFGTGTDQVSATDLPDFGTMTATDDNILVADGSDFESVAMSGDATINNGVVTVTHADSADKVDTVTYTNLWVHESGDTMGGVLNMGDNKITGMAGPSANSDAATKLYVDNTAAEPTVNDDITIHGQINQWNVLNRLDTSYVVASHPNSYLRLPQFFSEWDVDDSAKCVDCDSSHALHPAFAYIPEGLFSDAYHKNTRWLGYGPICISDRDENPHIAVRDENEYWHEFFVGPESTWCVTAAGDSIPIGYYDSTLHNPVYDINDTFYFSGDAWTATPDTFVLGGAGHLSDQDLFVDYEGRLWLPFRGTGVGGHHIIIGYSDDGLNWDSGEVILSQDLCEARGDTTPYSPTGTWKFMSPSVLPDTNQSFEMWTVEYTSADPQLYDIYVAKWETSQADSAWRFVDSVRWTPSSGSKHPWHISMFRRGLDEIWCLFSESDSILMGDSSYLMLAVSYDDGLSFTTVQDTILGLGDSSWNDRQAAYRCDGCFVNTEGIDYFELYCNSEGDDHGCAIWETKLYFNQAGVNLAQLGDTASAIRDAIRDTMQVMDDNWNTAYDSTSTWDNRSYPDATVTDKGIASFNTTNFVVSGGAVSVRAAGLDSTNMVTASLSEAKLTISNAPTDEYALTWEASAGTGGQMTWELREGGGGDMLKSTYDSDEDGDIDQAAGGLEADVSAYTGLIGLNSGAVSEVDTKSELEGMLTDVANFAEADGDTWTGYHDFSGVTTMEIPNSNNPYTDVEGQITQDNDAIALEIFHGYFGSVLIPAIQREELLLWNPELYTDTIPLLYVDSGSYPGGIRITELDVQTSEDGTYALNFYSFTAADPPVFLSNVKTLNVGASDQRASSISLTDAHIAVGEFVYIKTPSTDIDWIRIGIRFLIKEND